MCFKKSISLPESLRNAKRREVNIMIKYLNKSSNNNNTNYTINSTPTSSSSSSSYLLFPTHNSFPESTIQLSPVSFPTSLLEPPSPSLLTSVLKATSSSKILNTTITWMRHKQAQIFSLTQSSSPTTTFSFVPLSSFTSPPSHHLSYSQNQSHLLHQNQKMIQKRKFLHKIFSNLSNTLHQSLILVSTNPLIHT